MTELENRLAEQRAAAPTREVHVFTVPPMMAEKYGTESIGLHKLKVAEEQQAAKRSKANQMGLAYELTKAALAEVDGAAVSLAHGSSDTAWSKLDPKIRQLAMSAYINLHQPEDEEEEAFLASHTTKV